MMGFYVLGFDRMLCQNAEGLGPNIAVKSDQVLPLTVVWEAAT